MRYTSEKRAAHFVAHGRAYMDACGRLVFYGSPHGKSLVRTSLVNVAGDIVENRFSGLDAFPDRAVLPPSPEYMARLNSGRGPLRPPVRGVGR